MNAVPVQSYWDDLRQKVAATFREDARVIGGMLAAALRDNVGCVQPSAARVLAREAARKAIDAADVASGRVPL